MIDRLRASLVTNRYTRSFYRLVKRAPGAQHLLRPLVAWLFSPSKKLRRRVTSGLAKTMIVEFDPRYQANYVSGDREPEIQRLLQQTLRLGDLFVDIGAHIGFFVLCAARLVGPEGRILALEPDPDSFAGLVANIEINDLHQVEVRQTAAWSTAAELRFERSGVASGLTEGKVVGARSEEPSSMYTAVEGARLDDLVTGFPRVIKVDVEGAEVEVLRGAHELLAARQTVWAVECHTETLANAVGDIFRSHGYRVSRLATYEAGRGEWVQVFLTATPTANGVEGASG